MNEQNSLMLSFLGGALAEEQAAERVFSCNGRSEKFGLSLSKEQSIRIAKFWIRVLDKTERVEFGTNAVDMLINELCSSPYITQNDYENTLCEMIELFYIFKGETNEKVGDCELVMFMKKAFDEYCHGSTKLLSGKVLEELVKHIRSGKSIETFRYCVEE